MITEKTIIFCGTYGDLIQQIAAKYGCTANVARTGYDLQDEAEQADYRRIIDALNEVDADDKPVTPEYPDLDTAVSVGYGDCDLECNEWEQEWRDTYKSLLP